MTALFPEPVRYKLADFAAHTRASMRALMRHPFQFKKQRSYRERQMLLHALSKQVIDLPAGGEVTPQVLSQCAIHIHAFYPDLLDEIVSAMGPRTRANVHLEVTVTNPDSVVFAEDLLKAKGCASAAVVLVPNIGRDLGPLFTACQHLFRDYQYVAHLHTKRSYHIAFGDDWRRYLVRNVVGSDAQVEKQISYFETHPECGVLYPENYEAIRGATLSEEGVHQLQDLLQKINDKWNYTFIDFPAGSMCWLRSTAYTQILSQLPKIEQFDKETGQINGTLSHSLERCLAHIPYNLGFKTQAFRGILL